MEKCLVEGCDRQKVALGLCWAHWARQAAHGDPGPAALKAYKPNGVVGYSQARRVLNAVRGKAGEHDCTECGRPATGYELKQDAHRLYEPEGQYAPFPYSDNPWSYDPLCRAHRAERRAGLG